VDFIAIVILSLITTTLAENDPRVSTMSSCMIGIHTIRDAYFHKKTANIQNLKDTKQRNMDSEDEMDE
jgi:hypothetical protein